MPFRKLQSDETRFWSRVDRGGPTPGRRPDLGQCWLWLGSTVRGYGQFPIGSRTDASRRMVKAHRFAYEALVGPIPKGLEIDHLCFVRNCVNPGHMEPVTSAVNTLRSTGPTAANAAKDQCVNGHPFDFTRPDGERGCLRCAAEAQARWRERHPERYRASYERQNARRAKHVA